MSASAVRTAGNILDGGFGEAALADFHVEGILDHIGMGHVLGGAGLVDAVPGGLEHEIDVCSLLLGVAPMCRVS